MKHKLLINGRKTAFLKEFFIHTDTDFECMSSSELWEDITAHFKYFQPDGYIFSPDYYSPEAVSHLNQIKRTPPFNKCAVFLIGESDVIDDFEERAPKLADLTIKRPISIGTLSKFISNFLDDREKKLREEAEAAEAVKKAELEKLASQGISRKKHILVIDDDRNVLKLLKAGLEPNYEVTTMVSGRMAEKFLETRNTDLILLDYEMPLENGPEVFVRLRANEKLAKVPIIFLTGVAETSKIKQVLELGPQGYLLKPIEMDRLIMTIVEHIG